MYLYILSVEICSYDYCGVARITQTCERRSLYDVDCGRERYTIEMVAEIYLQISLLNPLPPPLLMHKDCLQLVHIDGTITTTNVHLIIIIEGLQLVHIDAIIVATRVHLIIIEGDAVYTMSMTSKSSNEAVVAAIVHVGGTISTTRV